MSLGSRMTERMQVYARTAETDTWAVVVNTPLACSLEALSPSGSRRESGNQFDPDVTHTARCNKRTDILVGYRLRLMRDGTEYTVKSVRTRTRPGAGFTVLGLAQAEAVL